MSKNFIVIFLSLMLLFPLISCIKEKRDEKLVKIGVSLPLTGDAGVYGQAIKKGIELALDEITEGNKINIQLIYEDDQGSPSVSVSAINKLISIEKVSIIIGGAMSSTAQPIIPITEKAKVLLISPTATEPSLTENSQFFFRLWPSDNYDGKVMAEIAYNKLKYRQIAILYVNTLIQANCNSLCKYVDP